MERAPAAIDRRDGDVTQEDTVIYREIGTTGVSQEHALIERIKTSPLYRAYAAQRDREFLEETPPTRI
jgi:hypothetical protein